VIDSRRKRRPAQLVAGADDELAQRVAGLGPVGVGAEQVAQLGAGQATCTVQGQGQGQGQGALRREQGARLAAAACGTWLAGAASPMSERPASAAAGSLATAVTVLPVLYLAACPRPVVVAEFQPRVRGTGGLPSRAALLTRRPSARRCRRTGTAYLISSSSRARCRPPPSPSSTTASTRS